MSVDAPLDDIVIRLRRDCVSLIADEAADEIERLRAEIDKLYEDKWTDRGPRWDGDYE
jgi:enhancing lycopene biosynthesis protein 2